MNEHTALAWEQHLAAGGPPPEGIDPAAAELDRALDCALHLLGQDGRVIGSRARSLAAMRGGRVRRRLRGIRGRKRRGRTWRAAVLVGALPLLLGFALLALWPAPPAGAGWRVEPLAGEVLLDDLPRRTTASAGPGATLVLPPGARCRVRRDDRIAATIEGPARLVLRAARDWHCAQGRLDLAVAPGHGDFVVTSPTARVTVLGTRFALEVAAGYSRVQVAHGRVRFASGAQSVELGSGGWGLGDGSSMLASQLPPWPALWRWQPGMAPDPDYGRIVDGLAHAIRGYPYAPADAVLLLANDGPVLGQVRPGLAVQVRLRLPAAATGLKLQIGHRPDDQNYEVFLPVPPAGTWVDLRVPLAAFTPVTGTGTLREGGGLHRLLVLAQGVDRLEIASVQLVGPPP